MTLSQKRKKLQRPIRMLSNSSAMSTPLFTSFVNFSGNMNIPQRDIATREAAKLVLANLQKVLADATSPTKLIRNAAIPAFGIRWDARVISRVKSGRLCNILWSLRNSKLHAPTYGRVSKLWAMASETETDFPAAWTEWRATIGRFNLEDEFKLPIWVGAIDTFIKHGWDSPAKLALVTSTQLRLAVEGYHHITAALQLWAAAKLLFADLSSASFLVLKGDSENAEKFLHRINSATIRSDVSRMDIKAAINRPKIHKLPKDCDKMGPSAKLQTLRRAQVPKFKINRFFRTASQSIALTGIKRCFTSYASGIRCYYIFCELRGTPPFPVRGRVVTEWSSVFKPGPAFPNYVGYVRKACHFLEQPLSWDTREVATVAAALNLAGKGKFRTPNFIRIEFIAMITAHETRGGDFTQLAFISFLYALRVPSGALILRRAFKNDDITGMTP